MKKRINIKRKRTNKKVTKAESSSNSIAIQQDIAGLLTMLVQKLTSFETKIDTVLSRIMSQPLDVPQKQPATVFVTERRRESMYTHKAICAECGRDCEVPFRPSGNRPVYCRECFAKRKNNGIFQSREESKPKELTSLSVRPPEKLTMIKTNDARKKKKPVVRIEKKTSRKK